MSIFDLKNVKTYTRYPSLVLGSYLLEVKECKRGHSDNGKGEYFVTEFSVVEASPLKAEQKDTHPKGQTVSWVQTEKNRAAPNAIKAFIFAALGLKTEKEQADCNEDIGNVVDAVTGDENLLKGKRVRCEVVEWTTKEKNVVPINRYYPV